MHMAPSPGPASSRRIAYCSPPAPGPRPKKSALFFCTSFRSQLKPHLLQNFLVHVLRVPVEEKDSFSKHADAHQCC